MTTTATTSCDRVLQEAVAVVQKRIRKSDVLARWGGEEFMIITPLADLAVVETVAEDLRKAIAQHQFPQVGRITASFGASMLHPDDDARALIKRVDQALYRSKREGRNPHHSEPITGCQSGSPQRGIRRCSTPSWSRIRATMKSTISSSDSGS